MNNYQMYGEFRDEGKAYVVTQRKTPRNWYNYLYNDTYNAFVSQVAVGEGLAQDDLGRRVMLINRRMLYLTDHASKAWFSANGLPMTQAYDEYWCTHGLGWSSIHSRCQDISVDYTMFVPVAGNRETWCVTMTNHRAEAADLSAIAYCATGIDGGYRPQGYNTDVAGFDRASQSAMARGYAAFDSVKTRAVYAVLSTDAEVCGYDTAKNAFIGVYGSENEPEALNDGGKCRNSDCVGEKICLALEAKCPLQPGESRTIHFMVSLVDEPADALKVKAHLAEGVPEAELQAVKMKRLQEIGGVQVHTPDERLNDAFNGFYKYATVMGSRWARVRHNGYRDLMSDCECLSSFHPQLAWQRYKRALTYQYASGYAPRTFIDGAIRDNNFADCAVWITFTGYAIVMESGQLDLLQESVHFNDGSEASVYEHMKRSVEFLYQFKGQHGLIKIWGGDWNDCMNEAGVEGRGESVWLSIAWCRAARMLTGLAQSMGLAEDAARFEQMRTAMEQLIETYGWDGEYYITALDDNGCKIGSHENEEGSLYLNPQLWAVLGEVGSPEHRRQAMASVEKLETPLGTVVSMPPYTKVDHSIGTMTTKAAGVHENGGVYLHAMCWKLAVDAILQQPEKVARDIAQILPWDQTFAPTVGEPYILYNSYFGEQTGYRYASPGQSWRTASTAWFVKAMLLYVFGLQPELAGLRIRPCLPPAWKECSVTKQFRGCTYHIHYHRTEGSGQEPVVMVDGKRVDGVLPCEAGKTYDVQVALG